jgi:hypothetical protein
MTGKELEDNSFINYFDRHEVANIENIINDKIVTLI